MNLIVYPLVDYNSWISLVDAQAILEYHIEYSLWEALIDDDKIRYLTKAFNEINALDGFNAPDETIPDNLDCLPTAQANIAIQYLVNAKDLDLSRVKSEKVGPMSTTYNDALAVSSDFSTTARKCLESFGAYVENTSVLSHIRKVR